MNPFKKNRFAKIVLLILLPVAFAVVPYTAIHTSVFQKTMQKITSKLSNAQVRWSSFKWIVWKNAIEISKLEIANNSGKALASVSKIKLCYSLSGFIKGKVKINRATLDGIDITLVQRKNRKHSKIGLTGMLLTKSLEISNAQARNIVIRLPERWNADIKEANLSFAVSMLDRAQLQLSTTGFNIFFGDKNYYLGQAVLKAETDLESTLRRFPFIEDGTATLKVSKVNLGKIALDSLELNAKAKDSSVEVLNAKIKGQDGEMLAKANVDIISRKFSIELRTTAPIFIPYIGQHQPIFDTSGTFSGVASIKGTFPSRTKLSLKGQHTFSQDTSTPVELSLLAEHRANTVRIKQLSIGVDKYKIKGNGLVDLNKKLVKLEYQTEGFPLKAVFGKFVNRKYHPIGGIAKAKGKFEGWGQNFTVTLQGIVERPRYYKIVGERLEAKLYATYKKLSLDSRLIQDGTVKGHSNLLITYGKRPHPTSKRNKQYLLTAELLDVDLGKLLADYRTNGSGSGKLTVQGHNRNYKGKGHLSIANGSFYGYKFQKASSRLSLSPALLKLERLSCITASGNEIKLADTVSFAFKGNQMEVSTEPTDGFELSADYIYSSKLLNVKKLTWYDKTGSEPSHINGLLDFSQRTINLNFKGNLAISLLNFPYVRGLDGSVNVDAHIRGTFTNPAIYGSATMNNISLRVRTFPSELEHIEGRILFSGHKLTSDVIRGKIGEGRFELSGTAIIKDGKATHFNIKGNGFAVPAVFREHDLKLTSDFNLRWEKDEGTFSLSGLINVLDGQYTKDYKLIEELTTRQHKMLARKRTMERIKLGDMKLDLKIVSNGEFYIRNNLGDVELKAALDIGGTVANPQVTGTVETIYGELHYMGVDFDITRGFIDFGRGKISNPYVEITGEKDIASYTVTARLVGHITKLHFDLSAVSAGHGILDRQDALSLIALGFTSEEAKQYSASMNTRMASVIAAENIGRIIEQPLTRFTHLDVFRLEAGSRKDNGSVPGEITISRLLLGKQITDRLSFNFLSDVDIDSAEQTISAEYKLTDFLLLKGARSSHKKYNFNISIQFLSR